mgnify:CR=1 FL=1
MRGIGKSFARVPVLAGVDLDLHAGRVEVLAGENGAGKSTLVKILAGIHRDYRGRVEIGGRQVRFAGVQEGQAAGIAVIHQEMSLVEELSVADNIFLGREPTRGRWLVDERRQRAAARDALHRIGVEVEVERPLGGCPLPVKQMVEIAKALAQEARIIVMDEPTSALDEPEVERLFAVIEELKRQGCALVYITHRLEEIYRVADHITILRDGRRVGGGPPAELPPAELVRLMVGREMVDRFPPRLCDPGGEALRLEGVTFPDPGGGPRPLVADVDLALAAGEILGLAGLAGSGKGALLKGLFGALGPPAAGRVLLAGREHRVRNPAGAIRAGVALLAADRKREGLVPGFGIVANGTLASLARHSPRLWLDAGSERRALARRSAELDIRAADPECPAATLSGGNQQKVLLARWLETGPRVLLLDEPTRGVDVGAKHQIYRLLNEWTGAGMAILLVTSELPELLALSDRIVVLHRGRVAGRMERNEFSPEAVMAAAMGGEGER